MTNVDIQSLGYTGLGVAAVVASAVTENVALVAGVIALLVGLSTLMIRIISIVDTRARNLIHEMQVTGELPTRRERDDVQQALSSLDEKLDRLLERE